MTATREPASAMPSYVHETARPLCLGFVAGFTIYMRSEEHRAGRK